MEDKAGRSRFFQKIFLVADTKFEMILGMPFLKISNADVLFGERTLTWKSYTTNEVLLTTEQAQLIELKKIVIVKLDVNSKTFVVYMAIRKQGEMPMHFKRQALIKAQVRALLFDKGPAEIFTEYSDYSDAFWVKNTAELLQNTGMNKHAIELKESKQPSFELIYNLGLVELETLKTYIKTNLANAFIWPFKSPARAPIFFDWKPNGSLRLCVHYQGLNSLIIKNWYPLSLIAELLDRFGWAK